MFKVGDIVEWCGVRGVVDDFRYGLDYPVSVYFSYQGERVSFTDDGKYPSWSTEPSLKLVERPKKKVTKTMYQAIIAADYADCNFHLTNSLYPNETYAKERYPNFIGLGPAITFEVEE